MKRSRKKKIAIIALGAILLLAAAFLIYTGQYYPADASALAALESDGSVTVTAADYGWLLDGPGETDALIFYPGAKVDAAWTFASSKCRSALPFSA